MKHIIWLASYPKSGNTWFRYFLLNLVEDTDQPVDIDRLQEIPVASSRSIFDEAVGIESSNLSDEEIDQLRPEVYKYISAATDEPCFLKIHDAYTYLMDGTPLVPAEATHGVLYFIRSPLDIAVSFANHSGISIDQAINRLNDQAHCFCNEPGRVDVQLRQRLLSWSGHVRSWTEAENLRLQLVRYEDMTYRPLETFTGAVRFAGLEKSQEQIKIALEFSHISELQNQEREKGFYEKSPACPSFFRKGEVGTWHGVLTHQQVETIIDKHKNVMKQFGYLNEQGEPTY
jgi:aryl sulfotransferase